MMLASKTNMFLGNGSQPVAQYWGFYFEAEEPNCVVNMEKYVVKQTANMPNLGDIQVVSLESSRDGVTWTSFDAANAYIGNGSVVGTTPITLANVGDRVYFRCPYTSYTDKYNTYYYAYKENFTLKAYQYHYFTLTKKAGAHGNIMSLLLDVESNLAFASGMSLFALFDSCVNLTSAPSLPATTLSVSCYDNLFWGCTGLTAAPELPATTLAESCYRYMFGECTGLTTAPALHATTQVINCYQYMFYNCTRLNAISVDFTSWASGTGNWVSGVGNSGTFTCPAALGTQSTISRGVSYCPANWTVQNV